MLQESDNLTFIPIMNVRDYARIMHVRMMHNL